MYPMENGVKGAMSKAVGKLVWVTPILIIVLISLAPTPLDHIENCVAKPCMLACSYPACAVFCNLAKTIPAM